MKRNRLFYMSFVILLFCSCALPASYEGSVPGDDQEDLNASAMGWNKVDGKLKQISVGNNGAVWGVNSSNTIYRWVGSTWEEIPGSLKCVSVGSDGEVWGVNKDNVIYYREGNGWREMPGRLKQISVGRRGVVWGVNSSNTIYRWVGSTWEEIPGSLKCVSVGNDGTVWGVNKDDVIYRRDGDEWTEIPGRLQQISVGNGSVVWGVNSSHGIYRWTGSGWVQVGGALTYVAAADDGTVWGIDLDGDIWRLTEEKIPLPAPYQLEARGGVLSGKTVYLSAGHGKYTLDGGWTYMHGPQGPGYIEDKDTALFTNNVLAPKLENLGANVITVRERDFDPVAKIVHQPMTAGLWTTPPTAGKEYSGVIKQVNINYIGSTPPEKAYDTATATWVIDTHDLSSNKHALYVWYPVDDRLAKDAFYTVNHAGKVISLTVNQAIHGEAWRYLGMFSVTPGEPFTLTLHNRSRSSGCLVAAGAARLGGGSIESLNGFLYDKGYSSQPVIGWEAEAWYNLQRAPVPITTYFSKIAQFAYNKQDASIRGSWAHWQRKNSPGEEAIYITWHSNATDKTHRGTNTFIVDLRKDMDDGHLRDYIHDAIVQDLQTYFEAAWNNWHSWEPPSSFKKTTFDGLNTCAEIGPLPYQDFPVPGLLIEIAYHDNPEDINALISSYFQDITARAVCNGIIQYFAFKDHKPAELLPVPAYYSPVVPNPDHPYNSIQCRVQRNIQDPWATYKEITRGQQIRIGSMHDGTGYFAEDQFIIQEVTGPNGYVYNPVIGEYITPPFPGTYQVFSRTISQPILTNSASFLVK